MITSTRSPECEHKLSAWWAMPAESAEHRLAGYTRLHRDREVRALLCTIFADDPADSDPVRAARELWPLLSVGV